MKIIVLTILILSCYIVRAQDKKIDRDSIFWSKVKISESLETSQKKQKPAQFMLNFPKDGPFSWLLNMGVSYQLDDCLEYGTSKALVEYHRNTLVSKEQDNFQFGYGLNNQIHVFNFDGKSVRACLNFAQQ